ncbi:hypothetical protein LPJ61_002446 [Coemansia biformis]|uniref:Uncharacterized protein n=1 Tax=Coemansia biformis TaxID=1286918 RepID=A0A9W7YD34_9FUNG|nr:hypothetical protein LPJ61_002446 [Coemansia biformis]
MISRLVLLAGLLAAAASAQQTLAPLAQQPARNSFTPFRVIQAQTPEQRQAIQNLIQELQRSSPELFAAFGQPGSQQLALAVPPAETTGAAPQASPPPQQQSQQQPQQMQSGAAPGAVPVAPPPTGAPSAPPFPFSAAAPPAAASAVPSAATTPLSFALNALFPASSQPIQATPSDSLPFGLHFGSADSELAGLGTPDASSDGPDQVSSAVGQHHASVHPSSRSPGAGSSEPSSFNEWAGLDSSAATPAVTLAAIGLALLSAAGVGL